jgi:hypothetical protein
MLDGANGSVVGMVNGTSFGDQTITDAISVTTAPTDPWVTYTVTAVGANGYSLGSLSISFNRICQNPNGCDQ